jgi:type I restriction-modification system DNA methylase subunit
MADLFGVQSNPYGSIYEALGEVRELFHREGRIGDANAKLDETVKLLAIHCIAAKRGDQFKRTYNKLLGENGFDLVALQKLFQEIAVTEPFVNAHGISIFGARPHLAFEPGDENIASKLFVAAGKAIVAQANGDHSLDVLNEAFGHHVRDNFRSHTEDAQYMTPPEVVSFMAKLATIGLKKQQSVSHQTPFVMMDPACGVGSFITAWRAEYQRRHASGEKLPRLKCVGQDKVDRMARLAMMNSILSGKREDNIAFGNSLFDGSGIDAYNGRVNLILTNPPFGAKFPIDEIRMYGQQSTPIFANTSLSVRHIDSELLFIDRYLSLLKEGGSCLVIVPDGVISAKGVPAFLRQRLASLASLRAVIELPPVTFAQAGTRTKTAVLYFEKDSNGPTTLPVFFGEVDDLGFEVSKRKGVPIKRSEGSNQLPAVLSAFESRTERSTDDQGRPITAVWREINPSQHESWTPRQYKLDSKQVQKQLSGKKLTLFKLRDLVESRLHRRPEPYRQGKLFISVLHVIGEGVLDIAGLKNYQPVTPGLPVWPNEVIISRINPRIPRVLVVPELGKQLLCSSEFEILRPKKGVSPFGLAYMLMSDPVQQQIQSLTAGTSASHSRVKPEKLYDVQIPWPREIEKCPDFMHLVKQYEHAMQALIRAVESISDLRERGYAA